MDPQQEHVYNAVLAGVLRGLDMLEDSPLSCAEHALLLRQVAMYCTTQDSAPALRLAGLESIAGATVRQVDTAWRNTLVALAPNHTFAALLQAILGALVALHDTPLRAKNQVRLLSEVAENCGLRAEALEAEAAGELDAIPTNLVELGGDT